MNSITYGSALVPGLLPERTNVLGVGISVTNLHESIRQCDDVIRSNRKAYICVADVHCVMQGASNDALRSILNRSLQTTPDGMPLVWIGRLRGHEAMRRVYGPDLMMELCRDSAAKGYRHFFYGGKPGIALKLQARLEAAIPGIKIVGTYAPPFRPLNPQETAGLMTQVAHARPDVFWVGLGSPKQERFMAEHLDRLDCKLMVGVGAAFDFHSGMVREAPRWLHSTGLQWLHRLLQEPRRLWRRYLISIPAFLWSMGLQVSGLRVYEMDI